MMRMHILIWLTCLLGACTTSQNRTIGEHRPAIAIVGANVAPMTTDIVVLPEHIEDPRILQLFVAKGVTTVRNLDGRPFILDWRDRVASGALIDPTIITAGPILDGEPPLRPDNLAVADERTAAVQARAQIAAGYDFRKVYGNLSAPAYRTLASEARANAFSSSHEPCCV